jgi:hypothetical protein
MPDEALLRAKAREAVRAGKIPSRRPDRTWGGPGVGVRCAICGEPVTKDQLEFQVEFARTARSPPWTDSTSTSAASRHGSSSANGMAARTISSYPPS